MGFPGGTLLVSTHVFPSPATPPSITPTSFPNSFPPWTLTFSLSWGRRFCFQHLSLPQAQAHSQAWSHFYLSLFLAASLSLVTPICTFKFCVSTPLLCSPQAPQERDFVCSLRNSQHHGQRLDLGQHSANTESTHSHSLSDFPVFSLLPLYS